MQIQATFNICDYIYTCIYTHIHAGNGQLLHVRHPMAVPLFDHSLPFPRTNPGADVSSQRLQVGGRGGGGLPRIFTSIPSLRSGRSTPPYEKGEGCPGIGGVEGGRERPIAKDIAAGGEHSFAIDMAGRLWGWGWNNNGQLGQLEFEQGADEIRVSEPQIVPLQQPVVQGVVVCLIYSYVSIHM